MTAPSQQDAAATRRAQAAVLAAAASRAAAARASAAMSDAASAAGALYGAGTPQAHAQVAGTIVNATATATSKAIELTTARIEQLWRATDPYAEDSVQTFVESSGQLIVAAQRAVAQTTGASQAILARAGGLRAPGAVQIPDDVRGAHVTFGADEPAVHAERTATVTYQPDTGRGKVVRQKVSAAEARPDQIFNRAVVTYRYERSQGADPAAASRASVQRIGDIVDGNLTLAQRLAEQQALKQAGATHYRRVIHPELSKGGVCGLCVAASDRVYRTEDLKPIHLRCKCGVVPVADGYDPGFQLHKDDLKMLYTHAGEFSGAPAVSIREGGQIVRRQSSTAAPALKRTRYTIVHHAEFGPVLSRVRGEKVPFYTTAPTQIGHPPAVA